jgi:hypothetical protein
MVAGINASDPDRDLVSGALMLRDFDIDTSRYVFLGREELEGGFYLLDLQHAGGQVVEYVPGTRRCQPLGQSFTEFLRTQVDGWIEAHPEIEPIEPGDTSVVAGRAFVTVDAFLRHPRLGEVVKYVIACRTINDHSAVISCRSQC